MMIKVRLQTNLPFPKQWISSSFVGDIVFAVVGLSIRQVVEGPIPGESGSIKVPVLLSDGNELALSVGTMTDIVCWSDVKTNKGTITNLLTTKTHTHTKSTQEQNMTNNFERLTVGRDSGRPDFQQADCPSP